MAAMLECKNDIQRPDYRPAAPHEAFMVPLLRREIEAMPEAYLPQSPSGRALDVGCGRQPFRPWLEAHGFRYVSLDVAQNPEGTVDFLCEIDRPLPEALLAAGPFDFLLCLEVLEHVADWETSFANFACLMCSGARALVTCPHFYFLHEEPNDFWRPTPYAFQHFAAKYGFEVKFQKAAGDGWDILGTLLASSYPQPVGRSLVNRLVNRAYWSVHRLLLWGLKSRQLQSRVSWHSPFTFYQANVVVLEKT
ncbi:methyltransferase domain-containing protein [Chloracidobacterium validum]|uniref:Methyltransferase domain-containing protein n=1 Tax=Chloracidobacterium validum TaxID=2821543 RepID=A0ABX8B9N6_9BACT|nr:methyltransferase domain-containing protein [Chloracidobacterium validum]QUW03653.1 methyltransferase domain-containing protein [Chloracidobacterium validum]